RAFISHALGVCRGRDADSLSLSFGQQLTAFHLSFAVDHLGVRHGFGVFNSCLRIGLGILYRGFLASFCLQFGFFYLLLLERQSVLHGIGLGFGLQDAHLSRTLRLLDLLGFGSLSLKLGNANLFLLNFSLHTHLIVLLLLQKQVFKSFGVLGRKLNVPQHHFFDDDPV